MWKGWNWHDGNFGGSGLQPQMRLIDFGSFISVEGGLIYETLPAEEWRDKLQALGLEVDR